MPTTFFKDWTSQREDRPLFCFYSLSPDVFFSFFFIFPFLKSFLWFIVHGVQRILSARLCPDSDKLAPANLPPPASLPVTLRLAWGLGRTFQRFTENLQPSITVWHAMAGLGCCNADLNSFLLVLMKEKRKRKLRKSRAMGLVRITSWYPNFNGSHFGLAPSEIHRMTGLPPQIVWTMTYSHRPHPGAERRVISTNFDWSSGAVENLKTHLNWDCMWIRD